MTNIEKLNSIFIEVFSCDESALGADFDKQNIEGWDSVKQLSLTSALENTFDVFLDPEDIIALTSYEAATSILVKYDIKM